MDTNEWRADFPALRRQIDGRRITYLDSAATALKPRSVIDAVAGFYEQNGANIHRGKHFLSEEASNAYENVRYQVAQFLGAYGNEIVFVRNTTEALNLVASGLGLDKDDVVVGCLDSHHSQILPWRRHADLKLVAMDRNGNPDLDHYQDLLRLKPKVVALTHYSNVTGAIAPVEAMAAAAKQACGAIVVLDAAQSIPHRRMDVSALSVDFVAFSGHKIMGPTGIGCLFGRHEALEKLRPLMLGGGMVDWVDADLSRERKIPHRFESGTPATASVIGMGAALTYLERIPEERQQVHNRQLSEAFVQGALKRDYLTLLGPRQAKGRSTLVALSIRGCDDLSDIARSLSDSYGIMCRSGHLCSQPLVDAQTAGEVLRASAYLYNTTDDVEAFYGALDELVAMLAR